MWITRTRSMIALSIAHYYHYRNSYETVIRPIVPGYVFRFAANFYTRHIKSCPWSFKVLTDTYVHDAHEKMKGNCNFCDGNLFQSNVRTGILIFANDRQNTRLDRLVIPRCWYNNRVESLHLGERRRSRAYYSDPLVLSLALWCQNI